MSEEDGGSGLLQSLDTELFADTVEWCPVEGCHDILLCGTYQLEESQQNPDQSEECKKPQTRIGQLRVYRLTPEADDKCDVIALHHVIPMPGILDIKWSVQSRELPTCALVNAAGQVQVWQLLDHGVDHPPEKVAEVELGESCLGLSLDWSAVNSEINSIVTSDSAGALSVIDVNHDVKKVSTWSAHGYEAWICAFDHWNPGVIYSGGDDCLFKGWDLRVGSTPLFTNKRHTMGVCSIQSNRLQEYKLAVGSYDEELHIWDTRQMKRPLSETNLGGGIWRVKWDPFKGDHMLTATMYNGFHIVDTSKTVDGKHPVLAHYECSQNLGYGADWCLWPRNETEKHLISTCSFYNHSLQIRSWPP